MSVTRLLEAVRCRGRLLLDRGLIRYGDVMTPTLCIEAGCDVRRVRVYIGRWLSLCRKATPLKLVIIENEFAMEYGIEQQLLLASDAEPCEELHEIYEFGTGCLCCSSYGQFVQVSRTYAGHADRTVALGEGGLNCRGPPHAV